MNQSPTRQIFPTEVTEKFNEVGINLTELFSAGMLGERLGIEITYAAPDHVEGTMPVDGNTQPYGLLHGGASAALAETLGSIGAMLHAGPTRVAMGVDLNVTHHRGARQGLVRGVATPVHLGFTVACYDIAIHDTNDKRVCSGRISCALRDA